MLIWPTPHQATRLAGPIPIHQICSRLRWSRGTKCPGLGAQKSLPTWQWHSAVQQPQSWRVMSGERLLIHGFMGTPQSLQRSTEPCPQIHMRVVTVMANSPSSLSFKPSASNAHDRHFVDPCHTEAKPPPSMSPSCLWRLILQHALLLAHAYGQVCGHVPPYLPPARSPSCRFYQAGVRNNTCNFRHTHSKKQEVVLFSNRVLIVPLCQSGNIGALNKQVEISYRYQPESRTGFLIAFFPRPLFARHAGR